MSTIKSSTLQAMLDDVANDFIDALKTKQESLSKSELRKDFPPAKEDESEPSKEASDSAPADASASPAPEATDAPAAAPAPGADAPVAPDAGAAPGADAGMGDPAAEQQLDPAALQAEYAKLAPDELEMHLQAAMAAKQALAGAPAPGMGDPAAAPAPAPAAPAPEMKSEATDAKKDELEKSVIAKSEALNKAENETAELKKLLKAQSDEIASLHAGIQKIVNVPDRKAVTAVSHTVTREVAAPGSSKEWTKESIHNHLKTITQNPSLKKSDRALVTDFYCGVVTIDKLAHLFEEK